MINMQLSLIFVYWLVSLLWALFCMYKQYMRDKDSVFKMYLSFGLNFIGAPIGMYIAYKKYNK